MSEPRLPPGFEMPVREVPIIHQCRCVLVHPSGSRDRCGADAPDPDSPRCDHCVNNHHAGGVTPPSGYSWSTATDAEVAADARRRAAIEATVGEAIEANQ